MGWGTVILALLNLNMARALNIFFVTCMVNRNRTEATKFTWKH